MCFVTRIDAVPLPPDTYLTWLEVDVEAARHNYNVFRYLASATTRTFGVVKADAYGHGAVAVARALVEEQVPMLCVARVEEALELRAAGIPVPILVFAPPFAPQARIAAGLGCEMAVCAPDHIQAAAAAGRALKRRVRVHAKVDVGMGRLGVRPEEAVDFARTIAAIPELELAGVMSHFPCADMKPEAMTRQQVKVFADVRSDILAAGIGSPMFHCANSAAAMDYPESHFDAIRPGISLYGQYPSPDVRTKLPLRPAMTLKTRISFLKDVPEGRGISYGHTHLTRRPSRIATIPLGYADGLPRLASNTGRMMVRGKLAPIVGRVCMDLTMLDVTGVGDVAIGDEVLVFGRDSTGFLPVDAMATAIGTIGYEITTRIGRRLPRFHR